MCKYGSARHVLLDMYRVPTGDACAINIASLTQRASDLKTSVSAGELPAMAGNPVAEITMLTFGGSH